MNDAEIDKLLEQINQLEKTFKWTIEQSEKILKEYLKLEKTEPFNFEAHEVLRDRLLELEQRHQRDRALYNKCIKQVRVHFKEKYNSDILGLLDGDI
jgi:uncharacterized protein YdcH (DUF465 family)